MEGKKCTVQGGLQREERRAEGWGGGEDTRERWGGGGRRWSTGKPLRMAVLPDTGSDCERQRETHKDWRRERKNEREVNPPPFPIPLPTTPINMTMSKHKMHAFALK